MVTNGTPERMLTDDERTLLEFTAAKGHDGYPIAAAAGGGWTWEYRSVKALRSYDTRTEAIDALDDYLGMLRDCVRVESERAYTTEPAHG